MIEGAPDPGLYDYVPYRGCKAFAWPAGKKVAVWVSPNLEYYEIDPPLNPRRKAWAMPHPDVVGYAHRDHANRVGQLYSRQPHGWRWCLCRQTDQHLAFSLSIFPAVLAVAALSGRFKPLPPYQWPRPTPDVQTKWHRR